MMWIRVKGCDPSSPSWNRDGKNVEVLGETSGLSLKFYRLKMSSFGSVTQRIVAAKFSTSDINVDLKENGRKAARPQLSHLSACCLSIISSSACHTPGACVLSQSSNTKLSDDCSVPELLLSEQQEHDQLLDAVTHLWLNDN